MFFIKVIGFFVFWIRFLFLNHIIFNTSILPCSSNKWLVLWSIDSSRVVTAWSEFPCVVRGRMQYFFLLSKTELASLNLLLFVIVATSGQVINVDNLTKIHRMKHACTLAQNLFHYSNNHEGMLMITCLLLERRRKNLQKISFHTPVTSHVSAVDLASIR